jgi:hypothetical protein
MTLRCSFWNRRREEPHVTVCVHFGNEKKSMDIAMTETSSDMREFIYVLAQLHLEKPQSVQMCAQKPLQ